ncbi:MAG: S9 family peptidase [Symbiobacteriaceae bacterium]|nr:S9 family peptidase [Symbiobacteriaceae bacterium]
MVIEDLFNFEWFVDPVISPQGNRIALTRMVIDEESKEYRSQLYLSAVSENSEPHRISSGPRDSTPRWSTCGTKIAFVSNRSGESQIWLLELSGGEAVQLTTMRHGATNPTWSPDGTKIAFTAKMHPADSLEQMYTPLSKEEKDAQAKYKREHAVIVDDMQYRSDDFGFFDGLYAQIWVLELASGQITKVTDGSFQHQGFAWSPCSSFLVLVANRELDQDENVGLINLWIASAEGGELRQLTHSSGPCGSPVWSPDGKTIAYLGHQREAYGATISRIWLIPAAGGEAKCLTEEFDQGFGERMYTDMTRTAGASNPLSWFPCGDKLLATSNHHGGIYLYSVSLTGEVLRLTPGERHIFGWTMDSEGAELILGWSDPLTPGVFSQLCLKSGTEKTLFSTNAWLAEVSLSPCESFWCKGDDDWDLQCWLMKPVDWEEGKKYPLLHIIHGGPANMYGFTFNHTFQVMASAGFYVFFLNPRGGLGYGQEFQSGVNRHYGEGDYRDLMLALDYAIEQHPQIDSSRLGVTGISYGGFMTNWIVGHTDRYQAAITEASISNWVSFFGTSDIGFSFCEGQHGADPLSDLEEMIRRSPLTYVQNVVTPLLISHNETDYRCPIEQGEQLFVALKKLGREVRMIRFPSSNHGLPGSGHPALRLDRLRHFMKWFTDHIEVSGK